jgi:hypothetical protein
MTPASPRALAHALAPTLAGLDWGVGGSVLLAHLGLPVTPNDLDLVTTPAHFAELTERLKQVLTTREKPRDTRYVTAHFLHLVSADGVGVDVMAGIAVREPAGIQTWTFDPARTALVDGLPWMLAEDWLSLYALFGREARVRILTDYLAQQDRAR